MKAAIFGGAGFIGRNLATALEKLKWDVSLYDDFSIAPAEEVSGVYVCDVSKRLDLHSVLWNKKFDIICWFPAQQGYNAKRGEFGLTNVMSAYYLFDLLAKYPPKHGILLASSQAVYRPTIDCAEGSPTHPPSCYGFSKLQQERAFEFFCTELDIPLVALRYSIVLGGGQSLSSTESGIMRNWFHAWQADKAPEIYGTGEQIRDFVHISDVTKANLAAIDQLFEHQGIDIINIGGPTATVGGVAAIFHKITNCRKPVVLGRDVRPGGEYSITSACGVAEMVLRWRPKVKLEQQIQDFLDTAVRGGVQPSFDGPVN
jgi:nucleoside-diphosphate-sugar epimerase